MGTPNAALLILVAVISWKHPAVSQTTNLVCPTGWVKHTSGKCFLVVREPAPWDVANTTCYRNGGKLAEPAPYGQNVFLGNLAGNILVTQFWIGYNRKGFGSSPVTSVDGQWSDGRPEMAYFGHWGHGNPDVTAGECVYVDATTTPSLWYFDKCSQARPYACQISPCPEGKFQCAVTDRCISTAYLCNGIDNCGDGSDEAGCGQNCKYVVQDTSVQIESPNFPNQYDNGLTCQWTLVGPVGSRIEFQFTSFNTESVVDVVEIRVGGQSLSTSSRLAYLSGRNIEATTFVSTNNLMIVLFKTDDSVSSVGFSAKWSTSFSCGMMKLAGNRPSGYPRGIQQTLSLDPTRAVSTCETQCLNQDCAAFSYDIARRRCTLYHQITSPIEDSGFDMYVKRCPNQIGDKPMTHLPNAGGTLVAVSLSRQLSTPLYPLQLPGGLWSIYTIEAETDFAISVELLDNDAGPRDFVMIYDGDSTSAPALARFTSVSPQQTIVSTARKIVVHIRTETVTQGRGFLLSYRQGCNILVYEESGSIASPGYSSRPYPSQTTCTWQINNPLTRPLKLEFLNTFDLETNKDFVQVYVGENENGQAQHTGLGFTGQAAPTTSFKTQPGQQGRMFIRMVTSAVGNGVGFGVTFSTDCPQIDTVSKNIVISPANVGASYGEEVTVRCSSGSVFTETIYRSQPSVTVTCLFGGTWNVNPFPECEAVFCGKVPAVAKGFIVFNGGFYSGNSVQYRCETGYNMLNSAIITCQNDGTWSPPPSCAATTCPSLPNIVNGRYTVLYGQGTTFSTVVEISCDSGYEVVGLKRLVCGQGNAWSGSPPTCQRRLCNIPELENGMTLNIGTRYAAGDFVRVQCYPGYVIRGINPYRCAIDDYPTCIDVDECASGTSGCQQGCVNTPGGFECTCFPGYRRDTNRTSICLNINECDEGYCRQDCVDSEGGYTCQCDPGYELYRVFAQRSRYFLGEDGSQVWNILSINHTCIRLPCPTRPLTLFNGRVLSSQTSFLYGDRLRYMCSMGYEMVGSPVSTCQANGAWDFAIPFCRAITCPPAELPSDNPATPSKLGSAIYRETVQYTCSLPNGVQQVRTRQCMYNRETNSYQLVGDHLSCPVIDCGAPMQISGSLPYTITSTLYPTQFTFNCRSPPWVIRGASAQGDNVIRCESDGKWDYGSLSCDGPTCSDPGRPLDGAQVATSYEEYSLVYWRCLRNGYEPEPPYPIMCVYNASAFPVPLSWNGSVPVCIDKELPRFSNCPTEVILTRVHQSPGFPVPAPVDNSGAVSNTRTSPVNFSPFIPVSTDMEVTYFATDYASNTATCVVNIKILDQRPPEISGPSSVHVEITSADAVISVDPSTLGWSVSGEDEPTTLSFSPPYLNLTRHDIGRIHYITGTAEDSAGNTASSRIQVSVTGTKCRTWSLVVRKGTYKCLPKPFPETGYVCDIQCNPGYAFYENINIDMLRMECNDGQDWNRKVPECVALYYPTYRQDFQLRYTKPATSLTQGCDQVYTQQLEAVIPLLVDRFTSSVCNVIRPAVTVSLRTDSPNVTITGDQVLVQLTVEISPKGFDNRPYTSCAAYLFRVFNENQVQYLAGVSPLNSNRQNNCPELQMQFDGMPYNDFECHGHEEFRQLSDYPRTRCLECPLGYYTLDKRVCVPCERNTYRSSLSSDYCPACPAGSRSTVVGATSIDECSRTCPEGMISPQGVAPCNECPVNTYSVNATYCASCPPATFTRGPGKSSRQDCIAQCTGGSYSVDGLEPCLPCPINTYQPSVKQTQCIDCSDTQHTTVTGSVSNLACVNSFETLCPRNGIQCVRGGICRVAYYDYYCDRCPEGYTGRDCDVYIDPCASNPCHSGGTCILTVSGFRCQCPGGSSGNLCQFQTDNCAVNVCRNGGVCQDTLNNYNCLCPSYSNSSGPSCSRPRQPCSDSPCQAGSCTAYDNIRRKCFCSAGYTGDSCSINIDDCASSPCLHGGTCRDEIDNFRCECPFGYSGEFCEIRDNVCAISSCGANGACVDNYVDGVTECVCNVNYVEVNGVCVEARQCDSDPCQNGGVCSNFPGGYTCSCPLGYEGYACQNDIDDCSSNPCLHDGICVDKVNGYECLCTKPDTGGTNCEDTKDNCSPFPCDTDHSPSCTDLYDDYLCLCETGWTGKNCSERAEDMCAKTPCEHNATCRNTALGAYSCSCSQGWTGTNCENPINNCVNNLCQNNAVCVNTIVGYYCRCPFGYRGDRCETRYDVCTVANHCIGVGSSCQVINGEARCSCANGRSGDGCEIVEVLCKPGICQNGGTCDEAAGSYACACAPGYTGPHCETDFDECSLISCQVGHLCVDGLNAYKCICPQGKYGEACSKDIPYSGDLVFVPHTPSSGQTVDSGDPVVLNSTGLTVSFWVRYTGAGRYNPGTILTLYGLNTPDGSGTKTELVRLDGGKARVSFSGGNRLLPNTPYNIADGLWHHVALTWDGNSGNVRLFIDKTLVNTVSPYGRGRRLPQYGWIVLGGVYDPVTQSLQQSGQFEGKLSHVEVIPRAVSYPAELSSVADQTPPSTQDTLVGLSDGLLTDRDATLDYEGELTKNICRPGLECPTNTNDFSSIWVDSCPVNQVMYNDNRVSALQWIPPVFNNSLNVSSTSNLGDEFIWGTHYVTYVGTDRNGDSATCTLRLVNRRSTCNDTEPKTAVGGRVTCTDIPQGRVCRVACTEYKEELSQTSPQFYSCNAYSMWGSESRLIPFQLPACARAEDRLVNVLVRVEYSFSRGCDNVEANLAASLRAAFTSVNSAWNTGLCKAATCNAVPVNINCTGQYMEVIFSAINDPLTSSNSSGMLKSPDVVLREEIVDQDKINFQASVGAAPDERSLEIIMVPYCVPGTQLIGDNSCVECGAGTYYNNDTGRCAACEKGFYQELSRQFTCVRCGPGLTTPETRTQSATQCYDACPAGDYYSLSQNQCTACPVGSYQVSVGMFFCVPCPLGKSTINPKSTSVEQCIDNDLVFESTTPFFTFEPPATGAAITDTGMSAGVIAAIVLAILFLILLLILLLLCCCRDRLAACLPCCAGGGKVKPEQGDKWRYMSRYGASNDKYVNYRLSDVREKNKVNGGLPQARWTFHEDKAALMRDVASEGSETPPVVVSSAAPVATSPPAVPPLPVSSMADESPKRKKKKSRKHKRHHRTKETSQTAPAPQLAVTESSGKGPVALPPIPTNELGNPMMTSFAYCFERTPSGRFQQSRPKTEIANVHYGDFVTEKKTSTPRSLPMRNGDRIMVDSEEEDYR